MTPEQLDDKEVVRVLCERDGWRCVKGEVYKWERKCGNGVEVLFDGDDEDTSITERCYLHSTDALRPVLAKLTPLEWFHLRQALANEHSSHAEYPTWSQWLLTLDPPNLARCVASAILACRKEKV